MKRLSIILASILVVFIAGSINAANFYVRPNGGTYGLENGSSWTNAFDGFSGIAWGSLSAGDTIFIAGGRYTQWLDVQKSGTLANRLTIKRATVSNHGTDTGWNAGFDSQVVLDGAGIQIGPYHYITIDGVVEDGIFIDFSSGEMSHMINLTPGNSNPSDYVTLRYITLQGPGINLGASYGNTEAIHSAGASREGTYLTIQYCKMYNFPGGICRLDVDNLLVEYSEIHDAQDYTNHEDWIISYYGSGTIRNNKMWNTTGAGLAFDDNSGPWYVYGNQFYATGIYIGNGNLVECQRNTELYFYNNVVANGYHGLDTTTRTTNSTGYAYNNIFFNNTYHLLNGPVYNHDYNWYYPAEGTGGKNGEANGIVGLGSPFVNKDTFDFRLSPGGTNSPIDKGKALGSPYHVDTIGTIRPQGSAWDMGAYEYISGGTITPPNPPSGLKIVLQ